MSEKRVIVCGSRSWGDRQLIQDTLADVADELGTCDLTIVHGAAKGADRIAADEAGKHGFLVEAWPYRQFIRPPVVSAKQAPLTRNEHMAKLGADLCVAFWDGRSTGTAHMMSTAERHRIPVKRVLKAPARVSAGGGQADRPTPGEDAAR